MAADMRALIASGGIGGLALAQGLKIAGLRFAVYERDIAPTAREHGYRLHIDSYGNQALHECLRDALWQSEVPLR